MLYRSLSNIFPIMKNNTAKIKVTVNSANKCVQLKISYCEQLLTVPVVGGREIACCAKYDIYGLFSFIGPGSWL